MKKTLKKSYTKATLELSNGVKMEGRLIGAKVAASGEMVFSTAMLGYSEAMTDPSYIGQILVFSYSLIGNYGIPSLNEGNFFGHESRAITTQGIIVSDFFDGNFHYQGGINLETWLKENNVPGIAGLDTRYLVSLIRDSKTPLLGRIVPEGVKKTDTVDRFDFLKQVKKGEFVNPSKYNLMPSVSVKEELTFEGKGKTVAIVDCGVKRNLISMVNKTGLKIKVIPWDADLSKVTADGWIISDGPGDPVKTGDLAKRIAGLLKANKPVLGIGLGHQLLAMAAGAKTRRMPDGHRSFNQPVHEVGSRKAFMSAQNHSFEINPKTLPKDWKIWFENANDMSIEGIKHTKKPFMSTQFQPEPSNATNDTGWIITDFAKLVGGK